MNLNERIASAVQLLNEDKDTHLAATHGKWNLDAGKLQCVLQQVGLALVTVPPEATIHYLRDLPIDPTIWLSRAYTRAIAVAHDMGHTPLAALGPEEFLHLRAYYNVESCDECDGVRHPPERSWHSERCSLYGTKEL
jgi:hypothetical protein